MLCFKPYGHLQQNKHHKNFISQNIVYVLNEYGIIQSKPRMLTELTDGNYYNINDSQSDIIEELIHVETEAIMLNESACKSGQPDQILENNQNQNENMTQTKAHIEPSPHSLNKSNVHITKIIFTSKSCRNFYMNYVTGIY